MSIFRKKTSPKIPYDPESQQAAVRQSICTGELTVGFIDRKTGKFHEYMLARSESEVDAFCKDIGVESESIKRIY